MQVSTQRDQCTLVGSIYRDAHVLELDNRACISTLQYSTSINIVRLRSNYGKGSLQCSAVQYSTVQYSTVQ